MCIRDRSTHDGSSNDIAFTVAEAQLHDAELVSRDLLATLSPGAVGANQATLSTEAGMAKLSISGAGIMGRPGVAARLFDTLAKQGINLRLIATSEVKVSCLVAGHQGNKALQAAASCFELSEPQLQLNPAPAGAGEPEVRGVALDRDQAQVCLLYTSPSPRDRTRSRMPSSA